MSLVFPERIDSSGKIEYPSYTVYFDVHQNNKKATTLEKVQACAQRSFQLVSIFFFSSKDALFKTLGSARTSFKHTVLGYHGSQNQIRFPKNIHLIVFKFFLWADSISAFSIYQAQTIISQLFIINHVPVRVIQSGNAIIGTIAIIWVNRKK